MYKMENAKHHVIMQGLTMDSSIKLCAYKDFSRGAADDGPQSSFVSRELVQATDEHEASQPDINWNQATVACRWPHLRLYWDLFNGQPAYGVGESLEVGHATDVGIASAAVIHISHTEIALYHSSSTTSPEGAGETSDEEERPLFSAKKRRKHGRSATNFKSS